MLARAREICAATAYVAAIARTLLAKDAMQAFRTERLAQAELLGQLLGL